MIKKHNCDGVSSLNFISERRSLFCMAMLVLASVMRSGTAFIARSNANSKSLGATLLHRTSNKIASPRTRSSMNRFMSTEVNIEFNEHKQFLENVAKIGVPKGFDALMKILPWTGEEIVSPTRREGLIPFLVPISKNKETGSLLCYIRWPTQKEDMELQLVRTTEVGVRLQAISTAEFVTRLAVELDFQGHANAEEAVELAKSTGSNYNIGDYLAFLKSGKFPAITDKDLRLVLDRFLLTKAGAFPDCYERLATNFMDTGNEVSALVTCERAVSVFYGWGHPIQFHTNMLLKAGRKTEAKDSARASMGMPKWTIAATSKQLEAATQTAGFTGMKILGEMHFFRANDKREKDVEEGFSPIQITLDQAAHLMDAVALGMVEGGWDEVREELAAKYREGGYPLMADFITTV